MNLAPNGKPTNLTPEQYRLVRTPAFKKWFGDWENSPETASKVVDENGEPKIKWRGDYNPKNVFDYINYGGHGVYYFGDKNFAESFGDKLNSYFINSKKPFIPKHLTKKEEKEIKDLWEDDAIKIIKESMFGQGYTNGDINDLHDYLDNYYLWNKETGWFLNKDVKMKSPDYSYSLDILLFVLKGGINFYLLERKEIIDWIKNNNYDGYMSYEGNEDNIAVFNSNQIKLADGTNTTFDGSNPDIRFDYGGSIEEVKNYLKNIRVDKDYMESVTDLDIVQYQSDFGRKGTLVWRAYPEWGKDGLSEDVKGSIYISSIGRGTGGDSYNFVSSIEGKKDSRGEGAMALASLFLRYPLVHSVHYEDESGFENELGYYKISFWKKIGGDDIELMREDFFNYFTKKFGYNPDSNTQHLLERYKLLEELIAEQIKEKPKNLSTRNKQDAKQIQAHYDNLNELVALKEKRRKYIESINPDIRFGDGGQIPDLLSSQEVSDKLGRELHWWNDDIVYLSGIKYKKVFLKNEYKKIN